MSPSSESDKLIQFKRVLITTDFSEASRNALRYTTAIASHHGARLYIVHVVSSAGYKMVGPDAEVQAAELCRTRIEDAVGQIGN